MADSPLIDAPSDLLALEPGSEEFAALDVEEQRCVCASDFKTYLKYATGRDHHTPEPFQFTICDFLQGSKPRWQRRKKVIMGFRGCAKTYLAVRRYIEWRWLRVPQTQVLVHSSTDKLAAAIGKALMQTLCNDPLFAHLTPKNQSSTMMFTLLNHPQEKGEGLWVAGINTSLKSSRANLYVFDDVEPEKMPEAHYERIIAAMEEAELILHPADFLWPNGDVPIPEQTQYVVCGQPCWTGSAYFPRPPDPTTGERESHPLADAIYLRIPALRKVPVGTPGSVVDHPEPWHDPNCNGGEYAEVSWMPRRFDTQFQIDRRNKRLISPANWRLQMDIDINPAEGLGSVIRVSMLPRVHKDLLALTSKTMVVDPADSEDGAEWAIGCAGMDGNAVHVFDLMGFRSEIWDQSGDLQPGEEAWTTIFENARDLEIDRLFLEKNLKVAARVATRVIRRMRLKIEVFEYSVHQQKLQRVVGTLGPALNSSMVSFEPHVLEDRANMRQLSELRYTRLPRPNDRLDVLAGLVTAFMDMPNVVSVRRNAQPIGSSAGGTPRIFDGLPPVSTFAPLLGVR